MAKGVCKGCKKYKQLNKSGYCNVSNTLQGACSAEAWGMVAGEKLVNTLEKWASKYISKTQFQILMSLAIIFVLYCYAK